MLQWIEGVVASSLFPSSRQRCGYRVIDDWSDSEQRRDLQSNSIDPFASVSKLLTGLGGKGLVLPAASTMLALASYFAALRPGFTGSGALTSSALRL
jgi:hypothetical protein